MTPHSLRQIYASVAGDLGFSELIIAALLGHTSRGLTPSYVRIDEALRMAADKVAAEITAILDGGADRSHGADRWVVASALEHTPA